MGQTRRENARFIRQRAVEGFTVRLVGALYEHLTNEVELRSCR